MEPTETEERSTELKTEIKEEEDQPSTSATQSSPAPGQSKKKSESLKPFVLGVDEETKDPGQNCSHASWASEVAINVISLTLKPWAWSLHCY